MNERLATDGRILTTAFNHTLSLKPDIIHMSLGTTKWRYIFPLQKIVNHAVKDNILVVSAANNYGLRSFPAYLKGVVGVKSGRLSDYTQFYYKKPFFYSYGYIADILGKDKLLKSEMRGNSIAAAYITGYAAELKANFFIENNTQLLDCLKAKENNDF